MTTIPMTTTAFPQTARAQRGSRRVEPRDRSVAQPRTKARTGGDDSKGPRKNPISREFVSSHKLGLGVLFVIVFTVVVLYDPLRAYYAAWRTNEILTANLETLTTSNNQFKGQILSLMTPEGIKDKARKLGYVDQGESSVVVKGFTDEGDANAAAATEDPWYIAVLDSVFGFQGV